MTYLLRNFAIQKVPHLSRLVVVGFLSKSSFIMPRFLQTKVLFGVFYYYKIHCFVGGFYCSSRWSWG